MLYPLCIFQCGVGVETACEEVIPITEASIVRWIGIERMDIFVDLRYEVVRMPFSFTVATCLGYFFSTKTYAFSPSSLSYPIDRVPSQFPLISSLIEPLFSLCKSLFVDFCGVSSS